MDLTNLKITWLILSKKFISFLIDFLLYVNLFFLSCTANIFL